MTPRIRTAGLAAVDGTWTPVSVAAFPGRWNPRREIPEDVEPAATAAALALEQAGWWRPGAGTGCAGGLVALVGGTSWRPAVRFAAALRAAAAAPVGPRDFLFALPSSVAAVLGILFGFTDYQATLAAAGTDEDAEQARLHGAELIAAGRIDRALVVALGQEGSARRAAAWCLESAGTGE